jgi:hypothetical protein
LTDIAPNAVIRHIGKYKNGAMFNVMKEYLLMIVDHLLNACGLRQAVVYPKMLATGCGQVSDYKLY